MATLLSVTMLFPGAAATMAASDPPPTSSAPDGASTGTAAKPMITPNPDGTFTIQKELSTPNSKDAKVERGLVIPPQVVVPIAPTAKSKQ